jgi:hydrogenase maturation protease
MTENPDSALAAITAGRTAFVGIGNVDCGDDAVGVVLAEAMQAAGVEGVFIARANPENLVGRLAAGNYENVVFLDAVAAGAAPGSAVLLDAGQLEELFPQVSTHRLSLGTLARLISAGNGKRVWLLGIQPDSVEMGAGVSASVAETARLLSELIAAVTDERSTSERERICS